MQKKKQVILLERVKRLGDTGDLVSVALGFSRNYLIPQGKAQPATKEAKALFEKEKEQRLKESAERVKKAEALAKSIEGKRIKIVRQASNIGRLYGAVNSREIWNILREDKSLKFIERSYIILPKPIKETGSFTFKVEVYPDVAAILHVDVISTEKTAADRLSVEEEKNKSLKPDSKEEGQKLDSKEEKSVESAESA